MHLLYQLHQVTMSEHDQDQEDSFETFSLKFTPPLSHWQIIQFENEDAGALCLVHRSSEIFLRAIELLPRFQGKGLGSACIQRVISQSRTEGKCVTLQVHRTNGVAKRLYERLGFVVSSSNDLLHFMRIE